MMTPDECHQRAREAKRLAAETQDLWEREMLFKIADQWQLLEAHRAAKKSQSDSVSPAMGRTVVCATVTWLLSCAIWDVKELI